MQIIKNLLLIGALIISQLNGFSESVTLTWNYSPSPDITNYSIYYGDQSGVYTNTVLVGITNTTIIDNLDIGSIYYFAATASDTNGQESPYSNEAVYTVPDDSINITNITIVTNIVYINQYVNITNYVPFTNYVTITTNGATLFLGTKLRYGTDLTHIYEERIMIKTFTNPPSYFYSGSLIITNKPF